MTDKEIDDKWRELVMNHDAIVGKEIAFNIRIRFNPHHSPEQRKEETKLFWAAQVEHFKILKEQYIIHREELLKRVDGNSDRKRVIETLEGCIADDVERLILT